MTSYRYYINSTTNTPALFLKASDLQFSCLNPKRSVSSGQHLLIFLACNLIQDVMLHSMMIFKLSNFVQDVSILYNQGPYAHTNFITA